MDFLEFSDVSAEIKGSMVQCLHFQDENCVFQCKLIQIPFYLDAWSFEVNGPKYRV
jgi:hypothetical protein